MDGKLTTGKYNEGVAQKVENERVDIRGLEVRTTRSRETPSSRKEYNTFN